MEYNSFYKGIIIYRNLFTTIIKPDNQDNVKKDYIKYLNLTDWKGLGYEKGWCFYFICWNTFNFLMKPFPTIRYKIINLLCIKFNEICKE